MTAAQPWMKFYPQDWRADEKLRLCSLSARGLWIEMLAIMHRSERYGQLLISGRVPTDAQLAVQVGALPDQVTTLVAELEEAGVFSRAAGGAIYSRRMTRDHKRAENSRKNGKKGGNPSLSANVGKQTGKKGWDNPKDNLPDKSGVKAQKPEARYQKEPPTPFEGDDGQKPDRSGKRTDAPPDKPEGVCEQVWRDFVAHRKTKRASLTQTAMDGIAREATAAGWPLESALREAILRGWQGFKAEWVKEQPVPGVSARSGEPATSTDAFVRRMEAFNARKAVA